jgi:hypothetical protein
MRVIRKILVGLGVLFLVLIALFSWVVVIGRQFRTEQTPFVKTFVTDLSRHWNVADVSDRVAGTTLDQALTPKGQQMFQMFKQLGALRSAGDLTMERFNVNTTGTTGVFEFKGTFDNGEADVRVTVLKKGGSAWVLGFYLNDIRRREGTGNVET